MSHEVTLPSGATATVKDPDDLTYGEREDVLNGLEVELDGRAQGTGGSVMVHLERSLVAACVESWTVTSRKTNAVLPIPSVSPKAMREVAVRDIAFLAEHLRPVRDELFPDFGPTVKKDPETGREVLDEGSPTTPSGD